MRGNFYGDVLLFFMFSVAGWLWESTVCSLYDTGHLINRGFLNGPYCPIYGCAVLCGTFFLRQIDSVVLLFLCAGCTCCMIEYVTSYVMEKLFHARWWDYSSKPFNLHGRIYLNGFLAFGVAMVLVIKVIVPYLRAIFDLIPEQILSIISAVLILVFSADTVITLVGFSGFDSKLRRISLVIKAERVRTYYLSMRTALQTALDNKNLRLSFQEVRMLFAFPKLRSTRYDEVLTEIRHLLGGNAGREENAGDTGEKNQIPAGHV